MPRQTVQTTDELRSLLKAARNQVHLTQAQAAIKAGISEIWWAQVETGVKTTVATDTFVSMAFTVSVPSRALRKLGFEALAHELDMRYDWFGGEAF